jgi:hypothetical protein
MNTDKHGLKTRGHGNVMHQTLQKFVAIRGIRVKAGAGAMTNSKTAYSQIG